MIDPIVLLAFVPASIALNLTPGADMMFCLGQGLRGGPRAALAADAGIALGAMIHVTLAGLGLGAAVAAVPLLFDAIRWVGVGYLLFLAVQAVRASPSATGGATLRPGRAFRDALLVNLSNPKVILFVLAFIPQFVDPARAILPQSLVFGAVLAAGGLLVNGAVGVAAGGAGRRLAGSATARRVLGWVSAGIFGALAVRLAVLERG